MKLITVCKWIILTLLLMVFFGQIHAMADVQVNLRVYAGLRKGEKAKPSVTTSYYLKPIFSGKVVLDAELNEEMKELKKVFNLDNLKILSKAQWGWKSEMSDKQFQVFVVNGREFIVQLSLLKGQGNFRLEVMEKGDKKKTILNTEISLPQKKSTVFGFEDSAGKPYFLSFARQKDARIKALTAKRIRASERPKLIKMVKPVYPKVALRDKIGGIVILECTTDIYGRVVEVKVIKGNEMLHLAAIEAVRQWIYQPYIENGVPKGVNFTVTVNFSLNKKVEKTDKGIAKSERQITKVPANKRPKLIKHVEPVYPEIALKEKIEGRVILECSTDIYGRVKSVKVIEGHPQLFESAIAAVKQWIYQPYIIDGVPKAVNFTVTVNYSLDKKEKKEKK